MFTPTALLTLTIASGVSAWGILGHETVAYIAQNFVKSSTKSWAQDILSDTSSSYLANVSTWADSYRYTDAGSFSAPYHFIDAEDSPPTSCSVDFERDCGDAGCSVSAIANYTQRVQQTGQLSATEVNYALRFLVHFLGDITQPLHDEAYGLGGNDVDVTFNGDNTNLHATWDTSIPEELVGGYALSDAESWAANLTAEIRNGTLSSQKASWLQGLDVNDAQASAMVWAKDANKYVCSVVVPKGWSAVENQELYPTYYDSAVDTVELQIAKGGYRLAAWLDAIADKAGAAKRWVPRHAGMQSLRQERLDERELLPVPKMMKSKAKLRREAVGWGCNHQH